MKRLAHILCALCVLCGSAFGFGELTNEINGTISGMASYAADTHGMDQFLASYFYCMNPTRTNHIYRTDTSGDWETGVYQSLEEKRDLPYWQSFKIPGFNWLLATDNGGFTSNTTYSAGLDIGKSPGTFYNGTADTNEGVATVAITHWAIGRLPHDSSDGDSGAIAGNDACTNLDVHSGTPVVDAWHMVWTNGLSTDVVGPRRLGFITGSHFYEAGFLMADIYIITAMGYPTNVGSLTFDWGGAAAYTNFCTASGFSVANNILTATVHFDRMPMSWDVPDGTITNDARPAFIADPSLGNRMHWTLQVTNLPAGIYNVGIDGSNVVQLTDVQLAAGWNMFTNYNGALWAQRKEVLGRKRDQAGQDRVTLISHSAGSSGALGSDNVNIDSNGNQQYDVLGKRGSAYVTAMSSFITDMQKYDVAIHNAAVQTNHTFTITKAQSIIDTNLIVTPLPSSALYKHMIGNSPSDGYVSSYNPPPFKWIYVENVSAYLLTNIVRQFRLDISTNNFASTYFTVQCSNNFYNFVPPITNANGSSWAGTIYWRTLYYTNSFANLVGTSATHTFSLAPTATNWDRSMLADTNYLLTVAGAHPHIWFNPGNVVAMQNFITTSVWPTPGQTWSGTTNTAKTVYQAETWWASNTITNLDANGDLTAMAAANSVAFSYWMSKSNAMWDIPGACTTFDFACTRFRQLGLDQMEPYNIDPGTEETMGYTYDWLYPFMTTAQRSNSLEVLTALTSFCAYGDNWFYGSAPGVTNRIYTNTLVVPFFTAFFRGGSHERYDNPVGLALTISALGDNTNMLAMFPMFENYALAQFDPDQGDEGRGYSEQGNFKFDREFGPVALACCTFTNAKLWVAPVLTDIATQFAYREPVGWRSSLDPGDLSTFFRSQWYHTRYYDLALMTGNGAILRQYNRSYPFRLSAPDVFPLAGEAFLPFYFTAPAEADWPTNVYLDTERGWFISSSLQPNDNAAFTNGTGFLLQARPGGKGADHSPYTDGDLEMWAYGAHPITGGGAAGGGYPKHPMYDDGIMVNGLGVKTIAFNPIPTDPSFSQYLAATNSPDFSFVIADLSKSFWRTNGVANEGLGDFTAPYYNTNSVGQLLSAQRGVLFVHKKYLVVYDTFLASSNSTFQQLWHVFETSATVDTNALTFHYAVTNNYNGSNVMVYVQQIVATNICALSDQAGTNLAKFNPFTLENKMGVDGDPGPYCKNVEWFYNRTPTKDWHFMTVIYPVDAGHTAPTFTIVNDNKFIVAGETYTDTINFALPYIAFDFVNNGGGGGGGSTFLVPFR